MFSIPLIRGVLFKIGAPLWALKNNANSFFVDNIGILTSKTNLLKENLLLKQQINLNQKNFSLFNLLNKENEDLKSILNRSRNNQKLLLSAVLVKPFLSPYDTLIIDVGSLDGVKFGDLVLVDGNTFIGRIFEVYDMTSKVLLYSSPGEKIKVLIGNNNIEKEAVGIGGGNFMVEVPKETGINEGDSIIIPSISTNIFGIVEKIEVKESDSLENVLFKSPVNIDEIKWVEISIPNKK